MPFWASSYLCDMQKVKKSIPVYDICSLNGADQLQDDLIAEPFASYLKAHPNLHRPHGHSFYHLVYFTKGGGHHTIDFKRFPVKAGQAYFMIPGQVHSWEFQGETDGYVINFSEAFFRGLLADPHYLDRFGFWHGATGDNIIALKTEKDRQEAVRIMQQIITEKTSNNGFSLDQARLSLLTFFILAARANNTDNNKSGITQPGQLRLYNFRKLVDEYYARYKLPKDYAAMLYVTPNHLNALCRDLLGKPAGEVIRDRIILEAKRQLVNANSGIADIAYSLGFTDNSYFTKFFKKQTGFTPEDFKKSILQPVKN